MNIRLVCDLAPGEGNPRNSEGAFLRGKNGDILFAYSQYHGDSCHDHADCNIALLRSRDEGETWNAPEIIVNARDFGVKNVMSVSAVEQKNGDLAFYFLIKENDGTTTIGRALSKDGVHFQSERCKANFPPAYYVLNNDRVVRLANGGLVAPVCKLTPKDENYPHRGVYQTTAFLSEDDGESFKICDFMLATFDPVNEGTGLQEPGIYQHKDGTLYLWMRTNYGCQYESKSQGDVNRFTEARPSIFTAPVSPMQMKSFDGVIYAIYNPIPNYNGRVNEEGTLGRTPIVIRKSLDDGVTFGALNVIEDDVTRGYCYPAILATRDECLLLAYCRGDGKDGNTLCRLGIAKVKKEEIL